MTISFIIGQILAHTLADFWFQTESMCMGKLRKAFSSGALLGHIGIVFLLSWLLSFSWKFGFYALIIAVSHYLIDGIKALINRRWNGITPYTFIIDQLMHLLIVIGISVWYIESNPGSYWLEGRGYLLMIALGYVLCTKPANVLLKVILDGFHICTQPTDQELLNAGKLIGIFERLMVITFVLLSQYSAIGFLIAAKSIIRYKDSEKPKTEYVLIGTLYSFGFAILTGVMVLSVMKL